jgi:hypothetical protein
VGINIIVEPRCNGAGNERGTSGNDNRMSGNDTLQRASENGFP